MRLTCVTVLAMDSTPQPYYVDAARKNLEGGRVDRAVLSLWGIRTTPVSVLYLETYEAVCDMAREALRRKPGDAQAQSLLDYTQPILQVP